MLFKEFKQRVYSESSSFGLLRDISEPFKANPAKIKILVRPLCEDDINLILKEPETGTVNPRVLAHQRAIIKANIPTCYVATTIQDKPCYMQWLIGYTHNEKVRCHFKGIFPKIKARVALLEGAYASPDFRGLRIMPEAMVLIAEKAALINARWVITFVDTKNIASLKGCHRAGFKPYALRKEKWFLFRQTVSFHPLPENETNEYNLQIAEESGICKYELQKEKKTEKQLQF